MDSIEQTEPGYYDREGHFHACPEWRESVTQDQGPESPAQEPGPEQPVMEQPVEELPEEQPVEEAITE